MNALQFLWTLLLGALQICRCFSFTFPTRSFVRADGPRWTGGSRRFDYVSSIRPRLPSYSRPLWSDFSGHEIQADPTEVEQRFIWPGSVDSNVHRDQHQVNSPGVIFDSPTVLFRGGKVDRRTTLRPIIESTTEKAASLQSSCNIDNFTISYTAAGGNETCEVLLTQGPCSNGEWLIADEDLLPKCVPRPCPVGSYPLDQGDCVETLRCSLGKSPFISFDGKLFCICNIGTVLWEPDDKCYSTYVQGPCNQTSYLALDENKNPKCVPNLCDEPSEVPVNAIQNRLDGSVIIDPRVSSNFSCYMTGDKGPCREGEMLVADLFTLNLACEEVGLDFRQLLRTAPFRCSSGQFRDRSGRCRKGHRVLDFRTLFFG